MTIHMPAEACSRGRRTAARMRRLRVAMGTGAAAAALLGLAAPAHGLVLYFPSFASNDGIASFSMGESGVLGQKGFFLTGGQGVLGVAARHQFAPGNDSQAAVFAANVGSNTVGAFTVRSDGTLSPAGPPVATGGNGPISLAVSPDGRFLYAANHFSGTITAFRIGSNGALTSIGLFSSNGSSPWGLSVSPHGVLYVVNENSGTVVALRINIDGTLTALAAPHTIGVPADQFTASDTSVDGRFLFVTAGSGANQGVWSFPLNANGTLASTVPITKAPNPVPVAVRVSPSNRHLYVANNPDGHSNNPGNGGISGYSIGSNGSLTPIFAATDVRVAKPVSLDMIDRLPAFLFVGNEVGASIFSFSVDFNTGRLTPVGQFGSGGVGDAHFGAATTTTAASAIVNRDRGLLRFLKTPGSGAYSLTIGGSATTRIFSTAKPRRIVPVPGSGCSPTEAADIRSLGCTTTNVTEVRVFTSDANNTVNAQNGFPEMVICGSGADTVFIDLTDPHPFNCGSVNRSPVRVGSPLRAISRSARVQAGVAVLRALCPRNRQGGRCRGRLVIRRGKRAIGSASYSIRARRRATVRVPLAVATSRPQTVRVIARERARDGRPMTSNTVVRLRGR